MVAVLQIVRARRRTPEVARRGPHQGLRRRGKIEPSGLPGRRKESREGIASFTYSAQTQAHNTTNSDK